MREGNGGKGGAVYVCDCGSGAVEEVLAMTICGGRGEEAMWYLRRWR